jgi:hypothetical protein
VPIVRSCVRKKWADNGGSPSGATGTLTLEAAATPTPTSVYGGTISGFGTSDAIDLAGLSYVAGTTLISTGPTFTAGPGGGSTTFAVTNGTDAVQLTFAGNLTSHALCLARTQPARF